jgi:hypothetical protein
MASIFPADIIITSACDGAHSGPADPHHSGEAYDLRTHHLDDDLKKLLLQMLDAYLGGRFFAFLEAPGTPNEHIHVQRRKGTLYTIENFFADA